MKKRDFVYPARDGGKRRKKWENSAKNRLLASLLTTQPASCFVLILSPQHVFKLMLRGNSYVVLSYNFVLITKLLELPVYTECMAHKHTHQFSSTLKLHNLYINSLQNLFWAIHLAVLKACSDNAYFSAFILYCTLSLCPQSPVHSTYVPQYQKFLGTLRWSSFPVNTCPMPRTAHTTVHQNNGTQYCSTEMVLLIFPFLRTNITSQMWLNRGKGTNFLTQSYTAKPNGRSHRTDCFLEVPALLSSHGVCFGYQWNDVHFVMKLLHHFDVQWLQSDQWHHRPSNRFHTHTHTISSQHILQ